MFAILQSTGGIVSIVVYDSKTLKPIKELFPERSGYYVEGQAIIYQGDVEFSPDGSILAGGVGIISIWDTQKFESKGKVLGPFSRGRNAAGAIDRILFSPDGGQLAVLYDSVLWPESLMSTRADGVIEIEKEKESSKGIYSAAALMVFKTDSHDRIYLAQGSSGVNKSISLSKIISYSPKTGELLSGRVERPLFNKLTRDDDPTKSHTYLERHDQISWREVGKIDDVHVMDITAVAFSGDGRFIATGSSTTDKESAINPVSKQWYQLKNNDPIYLWDALSGKKLMAYGPLRGAVRELAFALDNQVLVSCQTDFDHNEIIWLWDVVGGELLQRIEIPSNGGVMSSCSVSRDGRNIAIVVGDKIELITIDR